MLKPPIISVKKNIQNRNGIAQKPLDCALFFRKNAICIPIIYAQMTGSYATRQWQYTNFNTSFAKISQFLQPHQARFSVLPEQLMPFYHANKHQLHRKAAFFTP